MNTEDDRPAGRRSLLAAGGELPGRRSPMDRLLALILAAGRPRAARPSDRDHGLGTCRWCLNIVTLQSSAWVHLATGHAICLDPPMGGPLTCTARPLPPAPQRWDVLLPADTRRARIAWTLGIIGADTTVPAPNGGRPSARRRRDANTPPSGRWHSARPHPRPTTGAGHEPWPRRQHAANSARTRCTRVCPYRTAVPTGRPPIGASP